VRRQRAKQTVYEQVHRRVLADARFLLRHKRWHSATYLGGYGLECLLKVAVCAHLNVRELPREYEVHDLAFLLNRAAVEEPLKGNQRIEQRFRRVTAVWSVELRYRGSPRQRQRGARVLS
jgi:hypothetical protein